ncbi:MAG: caspase family protein [Flavobacteriales bacterium]
MAAKGISLHIGLNYVDPNHYDGWDGELNACESDARDMAELAKDQGFKVQKTLIDKAATRSAVKKEISAIGKKLVSGDIFFLTYSGHGGQLPDKNGDEKDRRDETWCLWDGELIDDELYYEYTQFAEGVRIVVLSDSCHSGSVTREAAYRNRSAGGEFKSYRNMPSAIALRTYRKNKVFYDKLLSDPKFRDSNPFSKTYNAKLKATVRLISGCQDNQLSNDGDFNGLFTGTLLEVWNNGTFKGNYAQLRRNIGVLMPPDQTPNHYLIGKHNSKFNSEQAFSI